MDVLPNDDETMVLRAASEFLAGESTTALVRAAEKSDERWSPELWRKIAELGWLGLSLPEEFGGQDLPLTYLGLLFEEVGRHIAPIPMLSVMVPALILARHGTAAQRDLLPRVVTGDRLLTYAVAEMDGRWSLDAIQTTGHREGGHLVLSGRKAFVDNFLAADHCMVAFLMRDSGAIGLAIVDTTAPGIRHTALVPTAGDAESVVDFDRVRVPIDAALGADAAASLMDLAAVFTAALMVGAAGEATRRAVEYAKERHAFGQPIGAFQAIQHLCADMTIGVDGAQLLTREALSMLAMGRPAAVEVSQAKAFANEKCLMACRAAQQIHGGIGFIADFDQQLWYRRVTSWSLRCGTVTEHRSRIAKALLDTPGMARLGSDLAIA
jgi:alkylation response protein AidB-like acyl-CoA dehydrogenase